AAIWQTGHVVLKKASTTGPSRQGSLTGSPVAASGSSSEGARSPVASIAFRLFGSKPPADQGGRRSHPRHKGDTGRERGPSTLNTRKAAWEGAEMSEALVTMIDSALEQYRSRDLVSAAEVVDFLLDLRLAGANPDPAPLEQLLEQESTHAGN